MLNNTLSYTKSHIFIGLFNLFLVFLFTGSVNAQAPLPDLHLLVWSPDGTFLIGATPGQVITQPDNTARLSRVLWQLPADGSQPQHLAEGFAPELSPDGRFVTFTPLDTQLQPGLWGVDVTTGKVQPMPPNLITAADVAVAGDPAGRVYVSSDGKKRAILVNEFFKAALWLGNENEPAKLILNAEGELFSDLSWSPDGQSLALIRTPLGSQIDTAGELWRVDLTDNAVLQLSRNNVVDRSPVWSADGSNLAVMRNEQLIFVSSNQLLVEQFLVAPPPVSQVSESIGVQAQIVTPDTIRVIHHASNTCRSSVPVGQIDVIPFEDYVKRVVPHEVYPSWPAETLKAQAVAARTYAWDKILRTTESYDVTDWVNHQYMCDTTYNTTNQAVDDTAGQYIAYNGQPITAMFSAENSSPTKTSPWVNYLLSVDDLVSFGQILYGHGYGMGQWGAQRWADQHDWTYPAILRHYYSNVTIEQGRDPFSASDVQAPIVTVIAPWSNHYLTGNKLRLIVNANDDYGVISQTNVYLSTPVSTSLLVSENGPPSNTGYVVDTSAWTDQTLVANTFVITAEAFDSGGKRGASPPVVLGLDRVKPTGWLTTATTLTGTTTITDSPVISLTLAATDSTAGAGQIAMGRKDWEWQGEELIREEVGGQPVGQMVNDSGALNGMAMKAEAATDPAGSWSSSEITLPAPSPYRAYFRVKASDNSLPTEIARLEASDGNLIGIRRLHGADFRAGNVYQEFFVDFYHQTANPLTLKLVFNDTVDIWLDRLIVVDYPIPFTASPTYNYVYFRLKVIDGAENVSDDLLVLPTHATGNVFLPLIIKSPDRLDVD